MVSSNESLRLAMLRNFSQEVDSKKRRESGKIDIVTSGGSDESTHERPRIPSSETPTIDVQKSLHIFARSEE